jgi:hypothetical protein
LSLSFHGVYACNPPHCAGFCHVRVTYVSIF